MSTAATVRALTGEDLAPMRKMLAMFGEAFDDAKTYRASQPDDAYLCGLLKSETFIAVAAISGGTVMGGLAGYVLPKFEQRRSEF